MNDMMRIFANWPAAIPTVATVVTTAGETIPFNDYMLTDELILLIRPQPDASGTRRVIMKLSDIAALRIIDAIEPERFTAMGFQKHIDAAVRRPR